MSEKLKEALSAVVDGEADEFELRRVLDELPKDPRLEASWERYHLIGSAMRGETSTGRLTMRERIWVEIEGDVVSASPTVDSATSVAPVKKLAFSRWTSLAVAATVALAVVIGFTELTGPGTEPAPALAESGLNPAAQAETLNQLLNSEISSLDEERTDAYKLYHTQQRGMNQAGFGAFAKMVTYQKND